MKPPVLRFAPSPTGPLHMGGVRTALYNYLYARQTGGTFILRIEDTDQTRYVPGAEQYIMDALEWCGIHFDEGIHEGGANAPYRQSDRSELYIQYASQLLNEGKAYLAFDTEEELEQMRERLQAEGSHSLAYSHHNRWHMRNSLSLDPAEVKQLIDEGVPHVLRMKIEPDREVRFQDQVRGEVTFQSDQLDDKVLLKSDGLPTYHLANVVDDHLMGVTHVIRGEEWLSSTPLHVLLYEAFAWEAQMPLFVHLPLILKPDPVAYVKNKAMRRTLAGRLEEEFLSQHPELDEKSRSKVTRSIQQLLSNADQLSAQLKVSEKDPDYLQALKTHIKGSLYGKLSKRDGDRLGFPVFPMTWTDPATGDTALGYREAGYLPEAFINALALMGWNPGTEEEVMSMDRMIALFSLERINKSGARFNADKMKWFNEVYLRQTSADDLLDEVKQGLTDRGIEVKDPVFLLAVIDLLKERVSFTHDIVSNSGYFFQPPPQYDPQMVEKRWTAEGRDLLAGLAERWKQQKDWSSETLHQEVDSFVAERSISAGKILAPLRLALTGEAGGPPVFDIAGLIGQRATLERIEKALRELA